MLLNKVNRFILITFFIMFIVQFVPVLRVPLLGGYLLALFIFNFKKIRVDGITKLFFLLLVYFVIQNLYLIDVINLRDLIQSLGMVILYISFHLVTKGYLEKVSSKDLKKVQQLVSFLIPVFFISLVEWSDSRKAGILGNPNITAHTLLTIFPFALLLKPTKKRFLYLILVILFVIVMLASRSALLAFLLGIVGYFLVLKKKTGFIWLLTYTIGSVLVSYFAVDIAVYLFDLYLSGFSKQNSRLLYTGYNGREKLLEMALDIFNSGNQWLGRGFTSAKFEVSDGYFQGVHNGFLDLLLRSGYIGMAIFFIILIKFLLEITKILDTQKRAATYFSYISIISLTTNSSTFFVFNFVFFYFIFIYNLSINTTLDGK